MEIKIGVSHLNREVVIEVAESSDDIQRKVATALAEGSPLSLSDDKGRIVLVPAAQIAYIECGPENKRSVGFGAA